MFTLTFTNTHVDTFYINYGTLDDNRFNNAIVVVTILITWTLAVDTNYLNDTLHIIILITVDPCMICHTWRKGDVMLYVYTMSQC